MTKFIYQEYSFCDGDIKVFFLNIEDNKNLIDLNLIPHTQLTQILSYKNKKDRDKRLIARTFLYNYCKNNYQLNDFNVFYNKYAKPYFNSTKIKFSFSYSKDYILIGISLDRDIGVDIEYKDKSLDIQNLVSSVMHVEEILVYEGLNAQSKVDYFYDIWSSKESYIKKIGVGLSYDISSLNIAHDIQDNHVVMLKGIEGYSIYLTYEK